MYLYIHICLVYLFVLKQRLFILIFIHILVFLLILCYLVVLITIVIVSIIAITILFLSQSGTGKTTIFCVGVLQTLNSKSRETQALVLSPTRELAEQTRTVSYCIFI
jgi:hypothetical protein